MTIEENGDGDEECEREGAVGGRFVRAVESVRFVVFELVVLEDGLLVGRQDHSAWLGALKLRLYRAKTLALLQATLNRW